MEITLNGEPKTLPDSCTAQQLLEILGITHGRVAMEVDMEIIPRSTFTTHLLKDGDKVEIVHAVGGGSQ